LYRSPFLPACWLGLRLVWVSRKELSLFIWFLLDCVVDVFDLIFWFVGLCQCLLEFAKNSVEVERVTTDVCRRGGLVNFGLY
jgi:hypothetical protein